MRLKARCRSPTSPVADTGTAEAVKLMENIFRSVNIALVNELKLVYDAMGNITVYTYPTGDVLSIEYDEEGRQTERELLDIVMPVKVRANQAAGVAIKNSPLIGYNTGALDGSFGPASWAAARLLALSREAEG